MIFLDMDGVFADFNRGYQLLTGEPPPPYDGRSKKAENEMWENIEKAQDFFATLPEIEGAKEFYMWMRKFAGFRNNHAFLTACPHSNFHEVARQKKLWVANAFPIYRPFVIPTWGSGTKPAYMYSEGDILIDDWDKNILAWEAHGGKGIHFTGDWEYVKEKLLEHRNIV